MKYLASNLSYQWNVSHLIYPINEMSRVSISISISIQCMCFNLWNISCLIYQSNQTSRISISIQCMHLIYQCNISCLIYQSNQTSRISISTWKWKKTRSWEMFHDMHIIWNTADDCGTFRTTSYAHWSLVLQGIRI